ncbi:hypothetical protein EDC04DRAFT_892106 [Pisolithus marmoratus]|nr:hypothetical protein EDC04DRAFT_892106 [Pisolithus marmoratus]
MGFFDRIRRSRKPTDILPTDVVVFIVGLSGSGKSRFLSIFLQHTNVHAVLSEGRHYAERCHLEGMHGDVVLVDTPSLYIREDPSREGTSKKKWMDLNCTTGCRAAGILYMSDITSIPRDDTSIELSSHLEAFGRTCPRSLAPSAVHIVPTMSFGAMMSSETTRGRLASLQRQADGVDASMDPGVFDGQPISAWEAVLQLLERMAPDSKDLQWIISVQRTTLKNIFPGNIHHVSALLSLIRVLSRQYQKDGNEADLNDIITLRQILLESTPADDPKRQLYVVELGDCLFQRFDKKGAMEDLTEIIDLRYAALELTPPGHQGRLMSLTNLANCLEERLSRDVTLQNSTEVITLRRAALELTPPGHQERLVSLVNLANSLQRRFEREGTVEVLEEVVIFRRAALEAAPSGHREYLPSLVNLADCLEEQFRRKGVMQDLTETITLRRAALKLTTREHREHAISLVKLASSLDKQYSREGSLETLMEVVALRRDVLELAPSGHQEHLGALVNLANCLEQRFRKAGVMKDLEEMIEHRRATINLTPQGRQECFMSFVNLADELHQQYGDEGTMEDLTKIITVYYAVLEFTPPEEEKCFESLINYLSRRFKEQGTMADLEQIISFRRAALERTPTVSEDQCGSLLHLAECLREKFLKLGVKAEISDIDQAIMHACNALALGPPELHARSLDCLASCIELKIAKRCTASRMMGVNSSPHLHDVEQMMLSIFDETVKAIPLRLLNTYTGNLCSRAAQLSHFKNSSQYKKLLSLTPVRNRHQCEAQIRDAILKFFQFATLSHRWGEDEPLLRCIEGSVYDLGSGEGGLAKLQKFCLCALKHDFMWAWSDTCCIDKESSAELQEAIGSMFSWYHQSDLTIVHLSDVSNSGALTNSIWFKRGWTLQELLASQRVLFYTQDWSLYKNCTSLDHRRDAALLIELQKATCHIGENHLQDFCPGITDPRLRLQWASERCTTRPEDIAYSLFGIFDVHLPVLYGESQEKAIGRLLAEIISQSGDVSVLDWVGKASSFHSCFPASLRPYCTMPCLPSSNSSAREHVHPEFA